MQCTPSILLHTGNSSHNTSACRQREFRRPWAAVDERSTRHPLLTEEIIDCFGQPTHRLVLEVDGTVTITFVTSGVAARVDPATRTVSTPGVSVPPTLIDHAASMRLG